LKKKQPQEDKASPQDVSLAIIGIGCLFPKAATIGDYWSNIKDGVDAITEVPDTHWNIEDYYHSDQTAPDMTYACRGGFIDPVDFNPLLFGMSPKNIEATDTTQLLGMVVARQALLDAGYSTGKGAGDGKEFDRDRTSVILGVTGTLELVISLGARLGHPLWREALADAGIDAETAEDVVQRISEAYVPWQENSFPGLLGNVVAGRIANRFDLGGTNCVVDAACASSLSAIHLAAMELSAGRCDMAITGGMDTFNDIFMYMCFSKTPALSPSGNSRPFDRNGDGTILGEGLGTIVLKRLDDAMQDGDHVYAVIRGMGTSSDGRGNAIYAPSAAGQTKALWDAYARAQVSPASIELVEAHGTGTVVGDAIEAEALAGVYHQDKPEGTWCAIGSVKSMIGHTKAAAGVAGLIKTVMALENKVLPPTIKVDQPLDQLEPGKAPVYVNTVKRPWVPSPDHPRRAAVSSFGFGGSNFHCVLEEAQEEKTSIEWDGKVIVFAYSADSKDQLREQLKLINIHQPWTQLRVLAARSCQAFNKKHVERVVLVVEKETTDLEQLITSVVQMLADQSDSTFWQLPTGAWYGSGKKPGKLAVLFPGQGAQYVSMLRDLACQFPQVLNNLKQANASLAEAEYGKRLSDYIYPIPVFTEEAKKQQEATLRETQNAQPAIGVVSIAAMHILEYFGIKAEFAAGHSYGELVALCVAGCIDEASLYRLSRLRGELMAMGEGDHGGMLAVTASVDEVLEFVDEEQLDLVIANHNAPAQVVLSGATDQIEKASERCKQRGLRTSILPVAAAFHSRFVSDAETPFAEALSAIKFNQGRLTVLSNTIADVYPDDCEEAKQLLAGQLARPVKFVHEIEKMYDLGVRIFVEAGPGKRLTGLVKSILDGHDYHAFAVDASSGKRSGQYDLACLLAPLSVLGHDIELHHWDADYLDTVDPEMDNKPTMTIPICGANYMIPRDKRPPRIPEKTQQADPAEQTSQHDRLSGQSVTARTDQQSVAGNLETTQFTDAMRTTKQSILALQKMQEQTANLHRQYLQGQEIAQQTIQQLLEQQQRLLGLSPEIPERVHGSGSVLSRQPEIPESVTRSEYTEDSNGPSPVLDKELKTQDQAIAKTSTAETTKTGVDIHNVLLEVVSEKTGYPLEMLSLDMSLDTDLGIDSIKRVEILSALQERLPWAPTVNPEELGTFQFLQHIVEFLAGSVQEVAVEPERTVYEGTSAQINDTHLRDELLEIIAEKTGYPMEMLNLDMSLDADLGIDSIKRVEILSALQEKYPEAPTVTPEDLGKLHTLQQIVDYLVADGDAITAMIPPVTIPDPEIKEVLLAVVAEKTGYPVEMLSLDMSLDSDLGIDSIKRVEILSALQERLPEMPVVKAEDLGTIQTLQQVIELMTASDNEVADTQGGSGPSLTMQDDIQIKRSIVTAVPLSDDMRRNPVILPVSAVIWVTDDGTPFTQEVCKALEAKDMVPKIVALDAIPDGQPDGFLILLPANLQDDDISKVFQLIQRAGPGLRRSGKEKQAFLVSVSRLGGHFGLETLADANPVSGGIAGLIKTADKEWPEVACKVLDLPGEGNSNELAEQIVEESLLLGPVEVGITETGLYTVAIETRPFDNKVSKSSSVFLPGDVIVVTGGARGVTASVATALANTYQVNLLLLGRSPEPDVEADWLQGLVSEAEIKKAILVHSSDGIRPGEVEKTYQEILANREILANLKVIESAGGKAVYRSVDVRDTASVAEVINEVRTTLGPVRGIVHGAGVLADRLIEDKTSEQFENVYATKVQGLRVLLDVTEQDDLRAMVMFSSSTARFGRIGQSDYAAANEVLNKIAQQQADKRPGCRVVSVNWGPWDGGMVTPALKDMFASEGVDVIPQQAGADYLMQEISLEGPVEVVVQGDRQTHDQHIEHADMHVAFERALSVHDYPFLKSHVMNGRAVLPVAIMTEWFAHGAMHDNPGLLYIGFDNLRVFKGVTLESDTMMELKIMAGLAIKSGEIEIVPVELRSGEILHAQANVILAADYPEQHLPETSILTGEYPYKDDEIYQSGQLFHGPALHGIESIEACSENGMIAQVKAAPRPQEWMEKPIRSTWQADPLALDASFQLMILWCFQQLGVGSLPTAIARYRQYQRKFPDEGTRVIIHIDEYTDHRAQARIEFLDQNDALVARIDGYECVSDGSLNDAFKHCKLTEQA
jgi:acyl transferase domain-containing protein/short-subunit dehydrogenase